MSEDRDDRLMMMIRGDLRDHRSEVIGRIEDLSEQVQSIKVDQAVSTLLAQQNAASFADIHRRLEAAEAREVAREKATRDEMTALIMQETATLSGRFDALSGRTDSRLDALERRSAADDARREVKKEVSEKLASTDRMRAQEDPRPPAPPASPQGSGITSATVAKGGAAATGGAGVLYLLYEVVMWVVRVFGGRGGGGGGNGPNIAGH